LAGSEQEAAKDELSMTKKEARQAKREEAEAVKALEAAAKTAEIAGMDLDEKKTFKVELEGQEVEKDITLETAG